MAKDRLGDLIKARDGRKQKGSEAQVEIQMESQPLMGGTDLRHTFEKAEVLRQWIETVEHNVEIIRDYVKTADDINTNQKDLNEKIEHYFQNNTSISHQIQAKLKQFEAEIRDVESSSAEGRIKNIQYNTLKTRYQKVFRNNIAVLESYRNARKSQLESQLMAKGVKVTDEQLTELLEQGTDIHVFTDNILAQTAEAKRVIQDLEDRHQQLLKIETMLGELRDLFLQMSILIDNQQELIDRVEYQAEMAQNFVGSGKKELKEGKKKRNKYLKKKIMLAIIIIIIIAIILVLIFK